MTIERLPRCIVILLRHGLAQENLHASAAIRVCKSGQSELLCGGNGRWCPAIVGLLSTVKFAS
jgi:hypothetical protein